MYKLQILLSILFSITCTAAWPWPPLFHELSERDATSSNATSAPSTVTQASAAATQTPSSSPTKTAKRLGTSSTSKSHGPTSISPNLPPGGIQILEPTPIAPSSFYKIGAPVSFAWNYTSLLITPSAVDVIVSCSSIDATYTVTTGMKVQDSAAATVVWDTAPEETGANPLLTEHYTLIVYEAGTAVTAIPAAGRLAPFSQLQFAMYVPQAPTALGEFVCATCSGAVSDMERQTFKFLFGMVVVTVFSFSWFAGGFLAYF